MIKFEFAKPKGANAENAMVYLPGQDYVMFNGLKIQLDRVLRANENWVGCVFCPYNRINFIECTKGGGGNNGVVVHSAEIVSSSTMETKGKMHGSESEADEEEEERQDQRISSMRVKQAAILLKAVKRASESVGDVVRLIKSFDREAEEGCFDRDSGAKLGIADCLRKRRGAVSLRAMERTLQMLEDESIEIIHEELDIPPLKRLRH